MKLTNLFFLIMFLLTSLSAQPMNSENVIEQKILYDIKTKQKISKKTLEDLIKNGKIKILKKLLKNKPYNSSIFDIQYLLFKASRIGNPETIDMLLKNGAIDFLKNPITKKSPFQTAIKNGHLEAVEKYIHNNAFIELEHLIVAAENGHQEILESLYKFGRDIDINQTHRYGSTILHYAINGNYNEDICLEIVKFLISKGSDINACNYHNITPLILATYRNKPKIVNLLLNIGANPYIKERRSRKTFYEFAKDKIDIQRIIEIHQQQIFNETYDTKLFPKELCEIISEF